MHRLVLLLAVLLGVFAMGGHSYAAYDKPYIGEVIEYTAKHEDTFVHLARDYNLGFTEMRAANPYVDPWLPGKGTKLILPARHLLTDADREGVVINLPEMRLYAFINGDDAPTTFPIGVGREGLNTPEGQTSVVRKKDGPTWTPTPRMRREDPELKPFYPPGPDNPLGTHALYLGWPTYAIHGTNKPFGIGRRISSGCIRMYPEDIVALFDMIPVGTKVQVVNQPIKLAWIDDRLYLEAHPELEQAIQMEEYGQVTSPKLSEKDLKRIIKSAGVYEEKLRWPAIRMAIKERHGYPVEIARRPKTAASNDVSDDVEDISISAVADIDPKVKAIISELTGDDTYDAESNIRVSDDATDEKVKQAAQDNIDLIYADHENPDQEEVASIKEEASSQPPVRTNFNP